MLSKLGMMDSTDATEKLTAALNGYKLSADDAIGVVDKLVNIDLIAATSSEELATALQYVSSMANTAGISFDKMISLIAVGSETTRLSAETMGNAWKSVLSRMQQVKAGVDVDDMGESLNNVEKVLQRFNIELRTTEGDFRNMEVVLDEVGQKWKEFDNVEKAQIATAIAGTYQRNTFMSVMENYNKVLEYTVESQNAAGTSTQKYGAYMDSMQAQLNQLTATWEKFVNNLNQKGTFSTLIKAAESIINLLDKLLNEWGLLTKLGIPVAIGILAKTITNKLGTGIVKLIGDFKNVASAIDTTNGVIRGITSSISTMSSTVSIASGVLGAIIAVISIVIASVNEYNRKIRESILAGADAAEAYKSQSTSIEKLVKQYKDLSTELDKYTGNEEKTKSIKDELLEVQNQLNDAYGLEKDRLELVNGQYEVQIARIEELEKKRAEAFVAENKTAYNNSIKTLEKNRTSKIGEVNQINDYATRIQVDKLLKEKFGDSYSFISGSGEYQVTLKTEDAQEALVDLYSSISDLAKTSGYSLDTILNNISGELGKLDKTAIESANKVRLEYQNNLVALDDELTTKYNNLSKAVEDYNVALASGDTKAIEKQKEILEQQILASKDLIDESSNVSIAFQNVVDQIDKESEEYQKFKNLIEQTSPEALERLKEELKGFSFNELRAGGVAAFDGLVVGAKRAGVSVEELILILEELGIIEQNAAEKAIDSWSKIANATTDALKEVNVTSFTDVMSKYAASLIDVESGYNSLLNAVDEFNQSGYISASTFKSLTDNDLIQYLTITKDGLVANTDALLGNAESAREAAVQQAKLTALQQIAEIVTNGKTDAELKAIPAAQGYENAMALLASVFDDVTREGLNAVAIVDAMNKVLSGTDLGAVQLAPYKNQIAAVTAEFAKTVNVINSIGSGLSGISRASSGAASSQRSLASAAQDAKKALEDERKAIESLLDVTMKMLKQQYKDEEKRLNGLKDSENDRYNAWKDNLDRQKDLASDYYDDLIDGLEAQKDAESELYDERIKALEDETDAYEKKINAQLKILEAQKKEKDYQDELADKIKDVATIQSELAKLQFDDSIEAQKKKIQLTEQLAEKQADVDDYQADHAYDSQVDALNNELDRYKDIAEQKKKELEELKDIAEKNAQEEIDRMKRSHELWLRQLETTEYLEEQKHKNIISDIDSEIDKNKEKYDNEGNLRREAMQLAQEQNDKNGEFYQNLIQWNRDYGTGVDEDVIQKWDEAYKVLDKYGYKTIGVKEVLEQLTRQVEQAVQKTKDLESAAGGAGSAASGAAKNFEKFSPPLREANNLFVEMVKNANKLERAALNSKEALQDMIDADKEAGYYEGKVKNDIAKINNKNKNSNSITATTRHSGIDYEISTDEDRRIGKQLGLESDEVVRILKTGEAVIPREENLQRLKGKSVSINDSVLKRTGELSSMSKKYISNDNSNLSITIGDTIIQGSADSDTVRKLENYKKSIVNDVFSKINKHTNLSGFTSVKRYV